MLRSPLLFYSLLRRVFELHAAGGVLDPEYLGALHDDTSLPLSPVQGGNGSNGRLELMSAIVEDKRLKWGDREGRESLKNQPRSQGLRSTHSDERGGHVFTIKQVGSLLALQPEADLLR